MSDASSRETSRGKGENTRRFAKQISRDADADGRHPQWWRRQTGITEQAAGMPSRQGVPLRRDTATGPVCAAGKLPSPDRSFPTRKLTRRVGFPFALIVTVVRPRHRPGRPSDRPHSRSQGSRRTGGRRAWPGSRRSRPSRSGSGKCSWAGAYDSRPRLVAAPVAQVFNLCASASHLFPWDVRCPESRPAVRPRAPPTQGFVFKPTGRKAAGKSRWTQHLVAVRPTPHGVGKDRGSVLAASHALRRWD